MSIQQYLDRMREHYSDRTARIKRNCAARSERLRQNYAAQRGRMKDNRSAQMKKIRDNYMDRRAKLREYSSGQVMYRIRIAKGKRLRRVYFLQLV